MEDASAHVFFSLLRSGVQGDCLTDAEKAYVLENMIPSFFSVSKRHDVAHILGYSLEMNGLVDNNLPVASKLYEQQMTAIYRYEHILYETENIRKVLTEIKIPFVLLKGAVIREIYPEPWMRTSCDIDVLVHEEDIDACVRALCEKLQYTAEKDRAYHDISLYSQSGVHLELHFNILENSEKLDKVLSEVWEYCSPISENSYEYKMSNEYLFFHIVAHMSYHFVHGGCGIKPFIDLWLLLNKLDFDEDILETLLYRCNLISFFEYAKSLCAVWFDSQSHNDITRAMQEWILSGGVYGSLENKIIAEQRKRGGKLRYIISRIFLPYSFLCVSYPVLKRHKWLLPVCHARRWFGFIFGGNKRRSMRELYVNSKISEEQKNQNNLLFSNLGLN